MARTLLINCRTDGRRVALLENGVATEVFFERFRERSIVGNVYKARVVRVLPGMQASFVEAGLQRTGFLFVGDVVRPPEPASPAPEPHLSEPPAAAIVAGSGSGGPSTGGGPRGDGGDRFPPIATLLKEGQELLVQISKEPISTKGARLTTNISLPGRHLVYLPMLDTVGVSRRIEDPSERERLRTVAEKLRPEVGGLIVRTVAEGASEAQLAEDVTFLVRLWEDIRRRADVALAPELVHEDLAVTVRSVRDLLTSDEDRVLIDNATDAAELRRWVARFMPGFEGRVDTYEEDEPLFERHNIELVLRRALARKVWLPSGGYIIIEETEALTAIDVNSGRYIGKKNFADTILQTNLEAVREIAYQLRLRNIGGIIIIDFIDMESLDHQSRVTESLVEHLKSDKARTKVLPMSAFGLAEMTRKRVRESIVRDLTEPCFYCDGQGYLRQVRVVAEDLLERLRSTLARRDKGQLVVMGHPRVTEAFVDIFGDEIDQLQQRFKVEIYVTPRDDLHLEHFEIR